MIKLEENIDKITLILFRKNRGENQIKKTHWFSSIRFGMHWKIRQKFLMDFGWNLQSCRSISRAFRSISQHIWVKISNMSRSRTLGRNLEHFGRNLHFGYISNIWVKISSITVKISNILVEISNILVEISYI